MIAHSFFDELTKIAEEDAKKPHPAWQAAKTMGTGLLGLGVGTAAGLGSAELANYLYKRQTGADIPRSALLTIAPALGTAAGLAYSRYTAKNQEAVERALKDSAERPT